MEREGNTDDGKIREWTSNPENKQRERFERLKEEVLV